MGMFRALALIAGGAVAGYITSQAQKTRPQSSTDLVSRATSGREVMSTMEGTMAKFFDSTVGKKLQPYALKTVEFAANVKKGMNEREAELKQRFETQKKDLRPGSLDTWDRPLDNKLHSTESSPAQQSSAPTVDAHVIESVEISGTQTRIERDAKLGDKFFE